MPAQRIPPSPSSSNDRESSEEVEVVENKGDARAALTADETDDDESAASCQGSQPIMSGRRAFASHAGTSGSKAKLGNAQTDHRPDMSRKPEAMSRPAQLSRFSSFTTSASASSNKRKKLNGSIKAPVSVGSSGLSTPPSPYTGSASSERFPIRDRRDKVVVHVPQLPLEALRQYVHAEGTSRITARYASTEFSSSSSGGLTDESDVESYEPNDEDLRYRRPTMARTAKAGPARKKRNDSTDDDSTDILGESLDDSSDDGDESQDSGSYGISGKRARHTRMGAQSRTYGNHRTRIPPSRGSGSKHKRVKTGTRHHTSSAGEEGESEIDELGQSMSSAGSGSDAEMEGEDELDHSSAQSEDSDDSYDSRKKKRRKTNGTKSKEVKETAEDILGKHRGWCEKCRRLPVSLLLSVAEARKKRGGKTKRKKDEFELDEVEEAIALGGWLTCEKCVTEWHWGCLGQHQKDDVLALLLRSEGPAAWGKKRLMVENEEYFNFQCRKCQADSNCFVCHQEDLKGDEQDATAVKADHAKSDETAEGSTEAVAIPKAKTRDGEKEEGGGSDDDIVMLDGPAGSPIRGKAAGDGKGRVKEDIRSTLRFRCYRCKQGAHYEHLPKPLRNRDPHEWTVVDRARYYQSQSGLKGGNAWHCHQCREWSKPDIIIAWRPAPNTQPEPNEPDYEPNWKDDLPREYLVRFAGRGFRHVKWVSHAWLRAIIPPGMIRKFLLEGPKLDLVTDETLAAKGDSMAAPTISNVLEEADAAAAARQSRHAPPVEGQKGKKAWLGAGPGPEVDAESGLPVEWSTIDRILDVCLRLPPARPKVKQHKSAKSAASNARGPRNRVMSSDEESEDEPDPLDSLPELPDGVEPDPADRIEIDDWEKQTRRKLEAEDVDEVARLATWCFVKWDDLQHDQSTWDTPPPKGSALYPAFKRALGRYLKARRVEVPILGRKEQERRDDCTLMPFQLNGLQWMLTKHYKRESAILADDMGLGKTVQIASLLGVLGEKKIFPCLVVVPNSTITNWVREFEKWVPHMRVVPYYGEAASRKVIKQYELYHKGQMGKAAGLKAHIVLTTYDMITGSEFNTVFASIPRWEVLCVDEGQRLKSDGSLIFARLRKLNTVHRLLLTGTPLNNNIRELFNLLNFLDPHKFTDRHELEIRYQQDELNEEKIHELHEIVKPYILRRIKADVLKLPPKIEIIVPISLSPLQKHLYRLVLDRNVDHIKAVAEARQTKAKAREARARDMAEKKKLKEEREQADKAAMAGEGGEREQEASAGEAVKQTEAGEDRVADQRKEGVDKVGSVAEDGERATDGGFDGGDKKVSGSDGNQSVIKEASTVPAQA